MNILDTRNLAERREALKQEILDSFLENFPHYEEMTESFEDIRFEEEEIESWKEDFEDELETIEEINKVEEKVDNYSEDSFEFGTTLIAKSDFTEFCQEDLEDCGLLPKDLPYFIENNIDWDGVADNLMVDYTEVEYLGVTYLFR